MSQTEKWLRPLDQLWATIRQTIEGAPGLYDDFSEPQLFFSAKETKLLFKTSPSRPTIVNAMENFASYFDRNMDLSFIDPSRLWVDLAKEICPHVSLLSAQRGYVGDEAQVYSWMRCCFGHSFKWMYDGKASK